MYYHKVRHTYMCITYHKNITTLLTTLTSISVGSLTVGRGHYINADIWTNPTCSACSLCAINQKLELSGVRSGPAHIARAGDRSEQHTATIDRPGMRFGLGGWGLWIVQLRGEGWTSGGKWMEPWRCLMSPSSLGVGLVRCVCEDGCFLYQYGTNRVEAMLDW